MAIRPFVATQDRIDHDVPCHAVAEALWNFFSVLLALHLVELDQGLRHTLLVVVPPHSLLAVRIETDCTKSSRLLIVEVERRTIV